MLPHTFIMILCILIFLYSFPILEDNYADMGESTLPPIVELEELPYEEELRDESRIQDFTSENWSTRTSDVLDIMKAEFKKKVFAVI